MFDQSSLLKKQKKKRKLAQFIAPTAANGVVWFPTPSPLPVHRKQFIFKHYLRIIKPGLIASHAVTADEFDQSIGSGGVQAVVIRHDLLPFCVGKHLVSAQSMTVRYPHILSSFTTHCIQARLRLRISHLQP